MAIGLLVAYWSECSTMNSVCQHGRGCPKNKIIIHVITFIYIEKKQNLNDNGILIRLDK